MQENIINIKYSNYKIRSNLIIMTLPVPDYRMTNASDKENLTNNHRNDDVESITTKLGEHGELSTKTKKKK